MVTATEVGGDYYDFDTDDDGVLTVVIVDGLFETGEARPNDDDLTLVVPKREAAPGDH